MTAYLDFTSARARNHEELLPSEAEAPKGLKFTTFEEIAEEERHREVKTPRVWIHFVSGRKAKREAE